MRKKLVAILAALLALGVAPQAQAREAGIQDYLYPPVEWTRQLCQKHLWCDAPKTKEKQAAKAQPRPAIKATEKATPAPAKALPSPAQVSQPRPQVAQAQPAPPARPKPAAVTPVNAWAGDGIASWVYYNRDPAYPSKAAAIADSPNVMRRAGWSAEVVSAMIAEMREAPERIEVRKGDRFDFMRSGPSGLWRNVRADFASPGRGAAVVVGADRWTVTVEGVTYELVIPDSCYNVAGRKRGHRVVVQNPCHYGDFETTVERGVIVKVRDRNDPCLAIRDSTNFHEADSGAGWRKVKVVCKNRCDVNDVGPGRHQVRYSPGNEPELCLEHNGVISFGNQIRHADKDRMRSGEMHARIYRESGEVPHGIAWGDPKGLAFWASTQAEADAMHASFSR